MQAILPCQRYLLGALLGACVLASCGAADIELCMDDQPHPPYLRAHGGALEDLLRDAAERAQLSIGLHRVPLPRCIAEIRSGRSHGYPMTSAIPVLTRDYAFPLLQGEPDPSRAVVRTRMAVFRRRGTSIDWDGQQFQPAQPRVLAPSHMPQVRQRMLELGLVLDDGARTLEQNFRKLLGARGDVVIALENDGLALLQQAPYAQQIEMLPLPLSESYYYLAFSRHYYAEHREQVERLWEALRNHALAGSAPAAPASIPKRSAPQSASKMTAIP